MNHPKIKIYKSLQGQFDITNRMITPKRNLCQESNRFPTQRKAQTPGDCVLSADSSELNTEKVWRIILQLVEF